METTKEFKARCLARDLDREQGIKYAERIGNQLYQEAADYIRENSNEKIMAYRGTN